MSRQPETNPHFFPSPERHQDQRSRPKRHQDRRSRPAGPRLPPQHQQHSPPPPQHQHSPPPPQHQHSPPRDPWGQSRKQHHQDQRSRPAGPQLSHSPPPTPWWSRQQHQDQHLQSHPHQDHGQGQHSQLDGSQAAPETVRSPEQQHQDHHHQHRPLGLWVPRQRKTNPLIWFGGVFCAIFWLVIILGGIIVLIIYLIFRPRSPRFDVSSATLNAAYLDMGYLLNADLTLLANFTNPNKKVSVDFSYTIIGLYYGNNLIASQYIEPFSAAKTQSKFGNIHLVTSQVRLPLTESLRLKKQIESNAVMFEVRGLFRARSNLGSFLRYSYWLYSKCSILVTGPPSGVLVASKCRTKR